MLRLAGIRIDSNTNGMHLAAELHVLFDQAVGRRRGREVPGALPRDPKLGPPVWSPDGRQSRLPIRRRTASNSGSAQVPTGQSRRIEGVVVNGVLPAWRRARPIDWLGDNRTLIVHLIPAGRAPRRWKQRCPRVRMCRRVWVTAGPAPTFEDLLSTPHDEDLFDYYATSQLAYLDASTGKSTPFGKPAIYTTVRPSPDLKHVLVAHLHKPYSYQLPGRLFPEEIEVWDRAAKTEYKVASLPLAEHVPLNGVRTGPRSSIGCRKSRRR